MCSAVISGIVLGSFGRFKEFKIKIKMNDAAHVFYKIKAALVSQF